MVGLVVSESSTALRLFISISDERSPMYYSGGFHCYLVGLGQKQGWCCPAVYWVITEGMDLHPRRLSLTEEGKFPFLFGCRQGIFLVKSCDVAIFQKSTDREALCF
jgi:hypothetical protein